MNVHGVSALLLGLLKLRKRMLKPFRVSRKRFAIPQITKDLERRNFIVFEN